MPALKVSGSYHRGYSSPWLLFVQFGWQTRVYLNLEGEALLDELHADAGEGC